MTLVGHRGVEEADPCTDSLVARLYERGASKSVGNRGDSGNCDALPECGYPRVRNSIGRGRAEYATGGFPGVNHSCYLTDDEVTEQVAAAVRIQELCASPRAGDARAYRRETYWRNAEQSLAST